MKYQQCILVLSDWFEDQSWAYMNMLYWLFSTSLTPQAPWWNVGLSSLTLSAFERWECQVFHLPYCLPKSMNTSSTQDSMRSKDVALLWNMYLSNEIKSAPMLCADFRQKNYKCWWRTTCTAHGQGKVAMEMVHMDMDMSRAHGLVAKEARVVLGFNCISCFLRPNIGFPIHLRQKKSSEEIREAIIRQ